MGLRLLVVDDHEVVREGLVATLGERYDVTAAISTGAEALDWIQTHEADVALVDFRLPDTSGDELCGRLREKAPDLAVVILTSYASPEIARRALHAGACGYVTKAAGLGALHDMLGKLERDATNPPSPGTADQIVDQLHELMSRQAEEVQLTPQQESVLELAALGLTNREIGTRLYLAEKTVKNHVTRILAKLGVQRRTQAALLASRLLAR
jgi:two-component system response regulator DevR